MTKAIVRRPGFWGSIHHTLFRLTLLLASLAAFMPAADAGTTVGTAPGQFSVSPTGAATYQISIPVPPGVNGLKPSLALLYNSQAGNGLLGQGWSLSGLSVISHCPKTLDQDGVSQLPEDNNSDRLCLDGERLILVGGTYWTTGSTYRTEIDSFKLFTLTVSNGVTTFTAVDRSGLTTTYGATVAGGNGAPSATPLLWLVSSITDKYNNFIDFTYGGSNYTGIGTTSWDAISKITYGNASGTVVGKVNFGYSSSRSDSYNQIEAFTPVTVNPEALTQISVTDGNNNVQTTYNLGYNFANGQSPAMQPTQLTSIQECGSNGSCYPATTFDYSDGLAAGFALGGGYQMNGVSPMPGFQVADFDGDGLPDYIFVNNNTLYVVFGDNNAVQVTVPALLASSNNGVGLSLQGAVVVDLNGDGKQELLVPYFITPNESPNLPVWYMLEWNGSTGSAANLIAQPVPTTNGTSLQVCSLTDSSCSIMAVALDIKSNGQSSLFFEDGGSFYYYANSNGSFNPTAINTGLTYSGSPQLTTLNWQGDAAVYVPGQPGLVGESLIFWNPSAPGSGGNGAFQEANPPDGQYAQRTYFLDANGDGLTEAVVVNGSSVYVVPNSGSGFDTSNQNNYIQCFSAPANADLNNFQVVDWFNDGRQQLIVPVGNFWYLFQPSQCAFTQTTSPVPTYDSGSQMQVFDVNGDGQPDLVYTYNNHTYYSANLTHAFLIDQITDGLGHNTNIGYVPLGAETRGAYVNNRNFTPNPVNPPQTLLYNGAMTLVKDFATDTGLFDSNNHPLQVYTYYLYGGAEIDQWGRGFLGFTEVEAINYNTGIYTINTYRQDFPFSGMVATSSKTWNPGATLQGGYVGMSGVKVSCTTTNPAEPSCEMTGSPANVVVRFTSGGTNISTTYNCYADAYSASNPAYSVLDKCGAGNPGSPQYPGVYSPYTDSTQTLLSDINSGAAYQTSTTTSNYQVVGTSTPIGPDVMPTDITVTTQDDTPGNNGDVGIVDTQSTYAYESSCPGHPDSVTVTHTFEGATAPSQLEQFTYDGNCFLTQDQKTIVAATGTPGYPKTLIKNYGPDAYGNPLVAKVSGTNVSGNSNGYRRTNMTYDPTERFPATITNPLGQTEMLTYDEWGNKLTDTDANGNTVTYQYDDLERKTQVSGPLPNVNTSWVYEGCTGNCATGVVYQVSQNGSDGSSTTVQYDELARTLRSARIGFSGETINQDTQYDLLGRPVQTTAPYKAGASICYDIKSYDVLNRVTSEIQPINSTQCGSATPVSGERSITTTYIGLQTIRAVSDPNATITSESTTTILNMLGKASSVTDPQGKTSYGYDGWGNLTSVTPPGLAGNTMSMTYDSIGDKLTMQDPDMGAWSYSYDALGELLSQTDAKGNTVNNQYDWVGRVTNRSEPEGTTLWVYDIGYGAGIGKLAYTYSPSGAWEGYAYDGYGETTDKITVIGSQEYWVTDTYDDQGRVSQVVYPTLNGISVSTAPLQPGTLTVKMDSNNNAAYDLSWPLAQNGQIYHLFRTPAGVTAPGPGYEIYSGPMPSWQDTTIPTDGTYTWWLEACNDTNCSGYTQTAPVSVTLPPSVPVQVYEPATVQTATSWPVSWAASTLGDTGTTGPITYNVQVSYNGGSTWTPLSITASSTSDDSNIYSGTVPGNGDSSYSYRVQACASGVCSAFSLPSSAENIGIYPTAPQNVSVPSIVTPQTSPASIPITWSAPAVNGGTTNLSYTVTSFRGSIQQSTSAAQSGTSFTDAETKDGKYSYTVTVCDNFTGTPLCAPSAMSSFAAVTLPPTNPGVPAVPANDQHSPTWQISWTPSTLTGTSSGTINYYVVQYWSGASGYSNVTGQQTLSGGVMYDTATAVEQSGYFQNGIYNYEVEACTTDTAVSSTAACTKFSANSGNYSTTIAPGVPTNISVPSKSNWDGSFTVSYGPPAAGTGGIVTGFNIQVYDLACTDPPNANCVEVRKGACNASGTSSSCTFPANSFPASNDYQMQINAGDNGVASPWVQAPFPTIWYLQLPSPATLGGQSTTANNSISLSWNSPSTSTSYATYYELYYRWSQHTGSYGAWTQKYNGPATSFSGTVLPTAYYNEYYVIACNQVGCAANSNFFLVTNTYTSGGGGCKTCIQTNTTATPTSGSVPAPAAAKGGLGALGAPSRDRLAVMTVNKMDVIPARQDLPDHNDGHSVVPMHTEVEALPVPASSALPVLAMNTVRLHRGGKLKPLALQQSKAQLRSRRHGVTQLAAIAPANSRQAYFLAHAGQSTHRMQPRQSVARHRAVTLVATARYARPVDPRLSKYPPLRRDPRVLAHFEAMGGYLPATVQRATLQENCGVSGDQCSEPTTGTAEMVGYVYNSVGYLAEVQSLNSSGAPQETLWQATDETAQGQVDQQYFDLGTNATGGSGAALSIIDIYDTASGLLNGSSVSANATSGGASTLTAAYTWDGYNNLLTRGLIESVPAGTTGSPALSESFLYDSVNRMTQVGSSNTTASYDAVGDIQNNGLYTSYQYSNPSVTVGSYTYNQPHAVTSLNANGVTRSFTYDNDGNLLTESGDVNRSISWFSYNKPNTITSGPTTETFLYSSSRERLQTTVSGSPNNPAGDTVTTTYIDGLFEQETDSASGTITYRNYILAGGVRVGVETLQANSSGQPTSDTFSFFVRDQVDSVVAEVTENLGGLNQQLALYSHDPWGKARPASTYVAPAPGTYLPGTLPGQHEGFAEHEDLEDIGIVDMEGRVYDPETGRFLSPDPNVQFPDSSQGYNRYTYVNNNPLSLSDPTGYFSFGAYAATGDPIAGVDPQAYGQAVGFAGPIVGAALNVVPGCQAWCDMAVTAASQAEAGYLETGSIGDGIKAGVIAGAEAYAFSEVGGEFGPDPGTAQLFERSMIEGIIGALGAGADGGDMASGFEGAFASSMAGPLLGDMPKGPGQMAVAALIGGLASRLNGGNFATGALQAALQNMFNEQGEESNKKDNSGGDPFGILDYNGEVENNPWVRIELYELRVALDSNGFQSVSIIVTGGESCWNPITNEAISLTDGSVIQYRAQTSAHNIENGARDVDIRETPGISDSKFEEIVREYTEFNRITNEYTDGHWHLGLPRQFNCPAGTCVP